MLIRIIAVLVFAPPLLVGLAAGLARAGWDASFLPSAGLAFRHGVLLCIWMTALAGLERAHRQGMLYALCPLALALSGGWMIAEPFARGPFVLLLLATLLLLVSNIVGARARATEVSTCRIVGSAFLLVGNALLFPDMPSHAVTSWWLGAALFYLLGLHLEGRTAVLTSGDRLLFYALIVPTLLGALLKNYALGSEFIDPYSVTPSMRWGGDRLLGLVMCAAAVWLFVRDSGDGWQRLCALGGGFFLALAGGLALYTGEILAGPLYEAIVHAFFVGFAFSLMLARFHLNSYLALSALLLLYAALLAWIVGALSGAQPLAEGARTAAVPCLLLLTLLGLRQQYQAARYLH